MGHINILGYRVIKKGPHGYSFKDGAGHELFISPDARKGFIRANLKSVSYLRSGRTYTSDSYLRKYEFLAQLVAEELTKVEPIYDYSVNEFYDPRAPFDYWKRDYILKNRY